MNRKTEEGNKQMSMQMLENSKSMKKCSTETDKRIKREFK